MKATRTACPSAHCVARALACALMVVSIASQAQAQRKSGKRPNATQAARSGANAIKAENDAALPLSGDPQKDQARQAGERDRLTTRIAELRKQIAAGEKSRSGAASALAKAERALADVNRRLDELAQRQRATQELAVALDRQRAGTEGQIAVGQADFGRTMTALYAHREQDPLRMWLGGGDPNAAVRTEADLAIIARAQMTDVDVLRTRAADLQMRRQHADEDSRALIAQAQAQSAAREALASSQAAQREALEKLSQQLADQRKTANALEADEKRLSRVVEQLQRVIEQKAAEEKARRLAAAKRQAEQDAAAARKGRNTPSPKRSDAPPPRIEVEPDEAPGSGAFAQLRGQLRLPVRGTVTGRFGSARGGSSATWKGLFVRADAGAEVRAVAAGKVIYADDLRGFGNLLIIDHGNQYLSIYGNNDALLKRSGDSVQAGEVISRAGNSIGDDQTGLYFELRFRGRPFDPMPWLGGR